MTAIKNPILFCKFLSPLTMNRNGFVFEIYIWISVFSKKKQFENPMLGCQKICKINTVPFFLNTLYYESDETHNPADNTINTGYFMFYRMIQIIPEWLTY